MNKLALLLIALFSTLAANADTWISIGRRFYEDPYWTQSGSPLSGYVSVEESKEHPGLYRFKHLLENPTSQYMYVHCENRNKVYVEKYSAIDSENKKMYVSQRCHENDWNAEFYGSLKNNEVIIPGKYFSYTDVPTSSWNICSSSRRFYLRLWDDHMPSGMYFGITAFNYQPNITPINLIDSSNKSYYQEFVNSQEMDDCTTLYYSVDKAIDAIVARTYPTDLNSAAIITFTDGNDDGSLDYVPISWNDMDYQRYLENKIESTSVQGKKLEAFSIGLKGVDIGDYNYDTFISTLLALASDGNNASEVSNMSEVESKLNEIIDKLQQSWLNKKVLVRINMRGTGDIIRFTLDKTREEMNNNPENSNVWIEGVFSREDLSLNNIQYHGFTSTSGDKVVAEPVIVDGHKKYQFTFQNLRDSNGEPLKTGAIHYWHKNSSTTAWQPHKESDGNGDTVTETEYSSSVVMLVMDCTTSLGEDDFARLKSVVNSVITRLADKTNGVEDVMVVETDAPIEYYNLQGIRIENPTNGIYIQRQGSKTKKIYIK